MTDMWSRSWPADLIQFAGNPKAVPMAPGEQTRICPNCGGHQVMMVYVIQDGPFQVPMGNCKWLDLDQEAYEIFTDGQGKEHWQKKRSRNGWYTGEMKYSPCPVCRQGQLEEYIRRNCGLRGDDLLVSIEDFRAVGKAEGKAPALAVARRLMGMGRDPRGFVTFYGGYGVGKSHLLKGIVNGFRQVGVMSRYGTLSDLLSDIRERFGETRGHDAEAVIDSLRQARVLCIDEIDKINLTDWSKETIFRLMDSRFNEGDRLLTVIALNVKPSELPSDLMYLGSRMAGGIVEEVKGPDMRPAIGHIARQDLQSQPDPDDDDEPEYVNYNTQGAVRGVAAGMRR